MELVRQPVGVVAAITPFNFPAMIPLWFLPYAIACGNAFVLKPSEHDPRPAALIAEMIDSHRGDPARRGQPGARRARGGDGAARRSRGRRDLLRRAGGDGALRRRARGGERQARAGAGRREELARGDARRGPGRRRCPAIMGSAFGAAGQRCLAGSVAVLVGDEAGAGGGPRGRWLGRPASCSSAPAPTRRPTSARWSRQAASARRSATRSAARRTTAPSWCSTGAATAGRPGRCSARRSSPGRPGVARSPARSCSARCWRWSARPTSTPRWSSLNGSRYGNAGSDLHAVRRGGAALPLRRRGRDARRQRRRPRPGRLVPLRRLEGLLRRRPARQRHRRGRFYTRTKVVTTRW